MRVGVDLGSAFIKISTVRADGVPVPADHPCLVPGHGVPRSSADPRAALRDALGPLSPSKVVLALPPAVPAGTLPGSLVLAPAVAAAVWARHRAGAGDGLLLVADLGAAGCRVVTCRMEDGLIGVVEEHSTADETGFGAVFDREVLAGAGADAALLWKTRSAADPVRVREAMTIAEDKPRYGGAAVYGAGPFPVSAVVSAWKPLAAKAGRLLGRAVAAVPPDEARLLVIGGMADFPRAVPDLAAAAPGLAHLDVPGLDGDTAGERPYAAAHGAALVAAGRAAPADRLPHPVTIRTRQITGGRLVTADVPVPGPIVAGDDARFAETAPPGLAVDALPPGAPVLDMRAAGASWSVADPSRLPGRGGTYRVGVRLHAGRPEMVLVPVAGGPPTVHPLTRHRREGENP